MLSCLNIYTRELLTGLMVLQFGCTPHNRITVLFLGRFALLQKIIHYAELVVDFVCLCVCVCVCAFVCVRFFYNITLHP